LSEPEIELQVAGQQALFSFLEYIYCRYWLKFAKSLMYEFMLLKYPLYMKFTDACTLV